jgi:CAAX prenyl protease-like protein
MAAENTTTVPEYRLPQLFKSFRWLPFVLPLLVYMLVQMCEPSPPTPISQSEATDPETLQARQQMKRASGSRNIFGATIYYENYPIVYTAKILLTGSVLLFVWPAYRVFPFRVSLFAVVIGVVGIVVWVGLCRLQLEPKLLALVGFDQWLEPGERPAYNPFQQLAATPVWACLFLAIRFTGLVLLVPIIEEMFYRAFLMRVVVAPEWWNVPIGTATRMAILMGIGFPALAHPGEVFASLAWFGMVTWLLIRTKNIWDCVAAHAITNLLLGIYVLTFDQWQLW